MIIIKTPKEIDRMRQGGRILAEILKEVAKNVRPGIRLSELNKLAEQLIAERGGQPSFKYYQEKQERPFPTALCASVNEELVHAPANRGRLLLSGDIIGLDLGIKYNGLFTDMAVTIGVGNISPKARQLIRVTHKALEIGIKQIKPGKCIHDVSGAIQKYVEARGFSVVRGLVGHGVGRLVHELPRIPNFVEAGQERIELKEGMTLAIEPMVNEGTYEIKTLKDGWTVVTADGSLACHFEHTVAVTKRGYEILTSLK